ncbi:MAG: leucine--tRNA ligase [Candidatus Latescibacterota bacterium]
MEPFDQSQIEAKWLGKWEETGLYKTDLKTAKKPFFNLMEFPYPSAEGLHVGHVYTYSGADTYGRFKRMNGYDVFEPMGFDAFGINAENFALKQGINPAVLISRTVENFRNNQMKRIGTMFDWSREINTSLPEYYRWTQWIFLQMHKAGLAVREKSSVNWCSSCLTVLANEQVEDGRCERCDTEVTQKEMVQWFFKITAYADRLLEGLRDLDWPDVSKALQANWIGRSDGAELVFMTADRTDATPTHHARIEVFTTRPDTVFGATYMVLAPEHPLVDALTTPEQRASVQAYRAQACKKREMERMSVEREKTGVFLGAYAINPATGEKIPIWIADYVLMTYGTGAIMAVPAHDQRDWDFARKFDLPIVEVVSSEAGIEEHAFEGRGNMVNSAPFDGLDSQEAPPRITEWLEEKGLGRARTAHRLRDWLISRQRYWGPPIPVVYCDQCGVVLVPEEDLPVALPMIEDFRPLGTGESPLAQIEDFVHTSCPECGGPARRETDVSDTFVDSSWYFLRYPSTESNDRPFERDITHQWLPVHMYMGGIEHVCRHHLYARFVTMVLHDLGYLNFEEPFAKLRLHGLILKDGAKMSKSRGNVVNPDEYIQTHGADVLRMYLLFLGPFEEGGDFSDHGIRGISRFLGRMRTHVLNPPDGSGGGVSMGTLHKAIKSVTENIESLKFNTAIARLMEVANWMAEEKSNFTRAEWDAGIHNLVLLLAPFAPFSGEELWELLGRPYSVHDQAWPKWNEELLTEETFPLVIQINGKLRDSIEAPVDLSEEGAKRLAMSREKIQALTEGKQIVRNIYIPRRLINLVVR